jgi:tryptophanyl-tRNA synthetase
VTRILSGIQPTGEKHLGNYLGAIRGWVADQERHECLFCLVDLHALTARPEPEALRRDTRRLAALLLACGLDPERCTLFVQSHVPAHAELAWILACITGVGELRRMTQFKAKSEAGSSSSAALLTYPVLQAADVLLYRAERVPVGEDQRQHLELARDLAVRFNHRYGDLFPLPEAAVAERGARVMDLQRPIQKMSTSTGTPLGTLFLLDPPEAVERKIRAAVTDPGREVRAGPDKPGVSNLLAILAAATGVPLPGLERRFQGRGYAALKAEVAEAVIALTAPIAERYEALAADGFRATDEVLAAGAVHVRSLAADTLARAKAAVGLSPAARDWRPDDVTARSGRAGG